MNQIKAAHTPQTVGETDTVQLAARLKELHNQMQSLEAAAGEIEAKLFGAYPKEARPETAAPKGAGIFGETLMILDEIIGRGYGVGATLNVINSRL